ncbi:MAG: HTH domain-containing protein, partial [Streptococcaceae bacterium]|nr:HTH domain-containing protein [Streptococcaceae bacterium]
MKKTERVTLIMRYINNRAHFTISEIQREFGISRATAIRDVQEIEAMGLPLVSEKGRAGGYSVLPNEFLPAVRFTPDELRAIFISFNASKNSQLPFLQSRKTISEKLLAIAPQTQQDSLLALDQLLLFESTNPANPSLLELDDNAPAELNQLITLALSDRHLQVTYERSPGWPQLMDIWVLHILSESGSWLLEIYDFSDDTFKFLPIAQLRHSVSADSVPLLSEKEIAAKKRSQSRGANLIVRLET